MLLSGPLLAGYTQTLNDLYDRDIDAINEPTARFPRGNSSSQVVTQILVLLLADWRGIRP
jgi:chlorophyll synthase